MRAGIIFRKGKWGSREPQNRSGTAFAPVPQVHEGQDWMAQEHARAGVAHDGAYLLTHPGRVANPSALKLSVTVNGAVGAGWFVLTKGALRDTLQGVRQQGGTLRAERG